MALTAGVDLGGTKILTVLVDADDAVQGRNFVLTPRAGGPEGVLDAIVSSVRTAMSDSNVDPHELTALGIGSPGQIDPVAGTVGHAGNLPEWSGVVPVADYIRGVLGCPVTLRNDVQSGVIAESRLGAGRGTATFLGVFCGTGVGGGIVLDGKLWRSRGAAGEIGHTVAQPGGRQCPCGRFGCLEAYAGRAPMEREARSRMAGGQRSVLVDLMTSMDRQVFTGEVWAAALAAQDELATELISANVSAMGVSLASAVNLLDLEAVIIGGGMGLALGQPYVDRVRAAMAEHLVFPDSPLTVGLAGLGDLAGALGAALAARGAAIEKENTT